MPVAGPYTPVVPTRICDTRPGNPSALSGPSAQCDGKTIGAGNSLELAVAGDNLGVPAGATTAVVDVTVAHPDGAGYLTLWPPGTARPTTSNVAYAAGALVSGMAVVGLSPSGDMEIYSSARANLVVDLDGYVGTSSPAGGGAGLYNALPTPVRVCDTRANNPSNLSGARSQCNGKTLAGGGALAVAIAGSGFGIPAGAIAVVANVTVANGDAPGYLTVYPDGSTPPVTSSASFATGQLVSQTVITELGADGKIDLVASASVDAIVDVTGYYGATAGTGYGFVPEKTPVRICDTRADNPSALTGAAAQCNGRADQGELLGPGDALSVSVAGAVSVPANAVSAVVTVTAVGPTKSTYLVTGPGGADVTGAGSPPPALYPFEGETLANEIVTTLDSSGGFEIYNHTGSVNVIVDLAGWYELGNSGWNQAYEVPVSVSTAVSGASIALLSGVSCTSAGTCEAVGIDTNSSGQGHLLAASESAGVWGQATDVAAPPSATTVMFTGVSCTSPGVCEGVGWYWDASRTAHPFADRESGGTWGQATEVAAPPGATSAQLNGVSCTSTGNCEAVGGDTSGFGGSAMVATETNGHWAQATEVLAPSGLPDTGFSGVSCPSPGVCEAIGWYSISNGSLSSTGSIAASETGGRWGVASEIALASPSPASGLSSISCISAGNCEAVGSVPGGDLQGHLLASSETNGAWSPATEVVTPPGGASASFTGISCAMDGGCEAVGSVVSQANGSSLDYPLVASDVGGTWSTARAPTPPEAAGTSFTGISCTSAGNCDAVGARPAPGQSGQTGQGVLVAAAQTNGTWGEVARVQPPTAAIVAMASFTGLSCTSASTCEAVGWSWDGWDQRQPIAVSESGGSWTGVAVAVPVAATNAELDGVSCTSAGNCTAVGYDTDSSGDHGLVATETEGSWSPATETAAPTGATRSRLSGVSCTSAGNCTAVGYDTGSSGDHGLVATETEGSWGQAIEVVPPVGFASPPANARLTSVSCPTAGNCEAVGEFFSGSSGIGSGGMLAVFEQGGTWARGTQVAPGAQLSGVSCTSAGDCEGAGGDGARGNSQNLIVAAATEGGWGQGTPVMAPLGGPSANAAGISCASPGDCVAVGWYWAPSLAIYPFAVMETGGTWSQATPIAAPFGAHTAQLTSVSCTSAGTCVAVGSFGDGVDSSGLLAVTTAPS